MARQTPQNKARTTTTAQSTDGRPSVVLVKEGRDPFTTSDPVEITNLRARGWAPQETADAAPTGKPDGDGKPDA